MQVYKCNGPPNYLIMLSCMFQITVIAIGDGGLIVFNSLALDENFK